jgi:type IV pilus assembly protein PilE
VVKRFNAKGFSLIELMIVVAIVGILAAVAVPSYQSHLIKASRSAVQTELIDLASLQEKVFLNSNNYTPNVSTAYNGTAAGGLGRTSGKSKDGKYTITLDITVPSQTFILTATPVLDSLQDGDGNVSISESGQRLWNGAAW